MARTFVMMQCDGGVHDRLIKRRDNVSGMVRGNDGSVGVNVMIAILLDHWQDHPPELEWVKKTLEDYPKRGRPRKTDPPGHVEAYALRKSKQKGHDFIAPRMEGDWIRLCKWCTMQWNIREQEAPGSMCPLKGPSIYELKRWKKSELIALNFKPEDVTWARDD